MRSTSDKRVLSIIYYSHPMETYRTCLEDYTEAIVKERFGRTYNISGWVTLLDSVDRDGKKEFLKIDDEMEKLGRIGKQEAKKHAKDLSHRVITTLRHRFAVNFDRAILNPAAFQQREFKRMTFPEFCRGLIDHCDVVVGHGDILNNAIRKLILTNMAARKSYAPDYHRKLRELVTKNDMIWTAGAIDELKHAMSIGKPVLVLKGNTLEEIRSKSVSKLERLVVPFYKPEWCAKTGGKVHVGLTSV